MYICMYTYVFVCLFFCLLVGIKPEELYSVSFFAREVNSLGVITHGQRHKPRAYQRQRYISCTCQSMVNTLQDDGLARISGLTTKATPVASSATERRTLMPCMTYWFWTGAGVKPWTIWWIEIANCPPTKQNYAKQNYTQSKTTHCKPLPHPITALFVCLSVCLME